jgi:hypothetical protein
LAHQLRVNHDAVCDVRGLAVWRTLEVLPWQTWIEAQCRLERQSGASVGRLLSPQAAGLIWRRLVEHDQVDAGVLSPPGLARAAYRSWRAMQAYQIPASALDEEDTTRHAALHAGFVAIRAGSPSMALSIRIWPPSRSASHRCEDRCDWSGSTS